MPDDHSESLPVMRPWLGDEEIAALADVVRSGWIAQGPGTADFERAFAVRVGAPHAVAVSSGTAALHLAMLVLDVGPGDEVVVPSLSYIATANAPRAAGATPVFADVDPATLNLTPETVEPVLTPRTRAVVLVHQAGVPADIARIHELCEARGIAVVEDAACTLGAEYEGAPIGAHSDLVAFSFHPRKIITTGEGGMVTTTNADFAARLARLRDHGASVDAWARHASGIPVERYVEPGFNYRLSDLLAAVGTVQLAKLDAIIARRRELAAAYETRLASIEGCVTATDPPWGRANFQSFWVVLPEDAAATRDEVLTRMLEDGIVARRGIMAAHLEPSFAGWDHVPLPVTEQRTRRSLVLPLFHTMTDADQSRVVDAFVRALR